MVWKHERYRHGLASRGITTKEVSIRTSDYPPMTKTINLRIDVDKAKVAIIRYMASSHYHDSEITTKEKMDELVNWFAIDDDLKDLVTLYYTDRAAFTKTVVNLGYGKVKIPEQITITDLEKRKVKAMRKQTAPEHHAFAALSKTNQRKLRLLEKEEVPGALFQVNDIEKLWDESNFDGRNHLLQRASQTMRKKRMKYKKPTREEKGISG